MCMNIKSDNYEFSCYIYLISDRICPKPIEPKTDKKDNPQKTLQMILKVLYKCIGGLVGGYPPSCVVFCFLGACHTVLYFMQSHCFDLTKNEHHIYL